LSAPHSSLCRILPAGKDDRAQKDQIK